MVLLDQRYPHVSLFIDIRWSSETNPCFSFRHWQIDIIEDSFSRSSWMTKRPNGSAQCELFKISYLIYEGKKVIVNYSQEINISCRRLVRQPFSKASIFVHVILSYLKGLYYFTRNSNSDRSQDMKIFGNNVLASLVRPSSTSSKRLKEQVAIKRQ